MSHFFLLLLTSLNIYTTSAPTSFLLFSPQLLTKLMLSPFTVLDFSFPKYERPPGIEETV